tara:strand:- start:71942 stop:72451 length:510 start_codon:yes stop_codon:yes gene_type:complete
MNRKTLLTWPLILLLSGCATSGLDPLVLDGQELHASLVTRPLAELAELRVSLDMRGNPYLATEVGFVEAIALRASQGGGLGREGIRAALYAVYVGENELLGIYGLEAASRADGNRVEQVLRRTWASAARSELARVHRAGEVLVVVWTGGVSPSCWETVNAAVVRRLNAP